MWSSLRRCGRSLGICGCSLKDVVPVAHWEDVAAHWENVAAHWEWEDGAVAAHWGDVETHYGEVVGGFRLEMW